jgi:hypothetical protein
MSDEKGFWTCAIVQIIEVKPYSFSSVAYVWVRGAKTTGPIAKKVWFLLNQIFFGK